MFVLYADKNRLTALETEPVTSGSVNAYQVQFRFSGHWDGLVKTAVFRSGCGRDRHVVLDSRGECAVPWEVLSRPGSHLFAGVYGQRGGEIVLPTVMADLGLIREGAPFGERPAPSPELWEQELDRKGDRLDFTDTGELGLYAGERLLSSLPVEGGGGTIDHRRLNYREAAEQHPIAAITGLERELSRRVSQDDALSVVDIIKILEE